MKSDKTVWLIAGLGNPGKEYAYNWHNLGFLAVDILAERLGISISKKKFDGYYGKGKYNGCEVILLKPGTYMNNSGISVAQAAKFYKVDPKHTVIIYDDIDIKHGTIRVRAKGSAGTHNGMKSVIGYLGTQDFPRIRIGSGPVPEHMDLVNFVLSDVPSDLRQTVYDSFGAACDAAMEMIKPDEGLS